MILWSYDNGYNALVLFFMFWILLISIGVILKLKNLEITRENYRHRIQDLLHQYARKLESSHHRKHT